MYLSVLSTSAKNHGPRKGLKYFCEKLSLCHVRHQSFLICHLPLGSISALIMSSEKMAILLSDSSCDVPKNPFNTWPHLSPISNSKRILTIGPICSPSVILKIVKTSDGRCQSFLPRQPCYSSRCLEKIRLLYCDLNCAPAKAKEHILKKAHIKVYARVMYLVAMSKWLRYRQQ